MQALHDCLLLNENKKINVEDPIRIKKEILHLIKYGSVDIVSMAINIVIEISNSIPTFFDDSDYKILIKYSNCYLTSIIEDVEFLTRDDLNLLTSYANLVTYICNNQPKIVGKQFNEWKKYIRNNHLPEVRVCADFLQHT
ncbi:hypothetical protein ACTIGL_28710 (plasmid) [Bacillus shihchuchen]|uniref:Immunity protein 30 domain-containing protein n=2 Tax=Bacillus cereus group TaxID=86661 RepID=A0ABT7KZC8_9BACI|nr:hypothetical protein [Bacillus shihchuchen]